MAATSTFLRPALRSPARLAGPIVCGCALAGAAALVAVVDPSETTLLPPCPWQTMTGWWCPGCGLTRATHHLLRGDVTASLRHNLLVIPVLVSIAVSWWMWMVNWRAGSARSTSTRPTSRRPRSPVLRLVPVVTVAVVFAVVRNLPGVDGLRG